MKRNLYVGRVLLALVPFLTISSAAQATLANRVFVSQRSGNDANACDNVLTPCLTLAGAVLQLNLGGLAIVLDSGGYGSVTITQGVTIEAPAGVTAFIHPPFGDAILISAGASDVVTLRGLTLNGGTANGITVNSVGTLNVENCLITGFTFDGINMNSPGRLNINATDITGSHNGVDLLNASGLVQASVDHCHLDGNGNGFVSQTTSPGGSTTTATYSTANNNVGSGWISGVFTGGKDVLNLEFCTGSENASYGLIAPSASVQSAVLYSNCVFANNSQYGVGNTNAGSVASRGNNTITGNLSGQTFGTITLFSPM